ncbi:MAG: ImmA/IrrE family metallo-endopeptidase [Armatimonadetes bacterium]|nr:ImmA/IrrE family metallo-endopeptidase [Armatimonadota bacterium]NIM23835.1 ImmA/IrrE family metallo-endopeptidase [Armatimonadota bacterium]NIM67714.1 ImmA/IrrE family metallo-endopeptidase [Armatimonadota bacterium]NIM76223.1 ImmA/IrrE family metallo-endopeptidase [Armatimonadota bacterium]NIN05916.1 ImmA/IrrE family metallo-endopeptidase [Armatimonadota bacterium]
MTLPVVKGAAQLDAFLGRFLRRYAFVNHLNIACFAEAFARHLRAQTVPRDPFSLLPMLGLQLHRSPQLFASRAIWIKTNNTYAIHYSQYENRSSIRFSLWHEAFEILAEHPHFPSLLPPAEKERLADRFAASLLMPDWAIRREVKRFATNGAGLVAVLADCFGVSRTAMRRRLREVAPHLYRRRNRSRPWTPLFSHKGKLSAPCKDGNRTCLI